MNKIVDLTGQKFGRLTVVERAADHILPCGHKEVMWVCECECGGIKIARGAKLRSGDVKSCGCLQKEIQEKRALNLTGQKFGRLTVIKKVENNVNAKGGQRSAWLCECECGKRIVVTGDKLKNGNTKSCGCLQKEKAAKSLKEIHKKIDYHIINASKRKQNTYDLSGDYGIGYTSNANDDGINYFYFDLEDYDKIKNYCWSFANNYVVANSLDKKCNIRMHRLIMDAPDDKVVDHKRHTTYDNRKENLRVVTPAQNTRNIKKNRDMVNKKYVGVQQRGKKYRAQINFDNNRYYLGTFDTFEEAVKARQQAEEKYYGEYRYQEAE